MSAASSSNDTTLFGYRATRIGDYPRNEEGGISSTSELIANIRIELGSILPEPLTDESDYESNENYRDVNIVIFNKGSRNGLFVNRVYGVWLLSGGEHPWAAVQQLDLLFNINYGKMTIETLK